LRDTGEPRAASFFRRLIRARKAVVAIYAILLLPAARLAARIPADDTIDRMIVESDPDVAATRAFHAVFPERKSVLLLAETDDPFSPAALDGLLDLERTLGRVPDVAVVTAPIVAERMRPGIRDRPQELRAFVTGTSFFRKQGLVGERFLGLALLLDATTPERRDRVLADIDRALDAATALPFSRVRRIGEPIVSSYLEGKTREASRLYFPLFGAFVVALVYFLFRSFRTLAAILTTLGVAVLFGYATGGLLGFATTIVSSIVPLTLLVTTSASLVYLQSRFVDCPADVPPEEHQVFALVNKFPAVTASVAATAVGFAALAVSQIRPVREMGIWTAAGLVASWAVSFTLFPALQRVFRTPTRRERALAGAWVLRAAETIPRWSYRWRWPLVLGALVLSAAGAAAAFGLRGRLRPMPLETDSLDYVDRGTDVYADTRFAIENVAGLGSFSLWLETAPGGAVDPTFLARLDAFASALEADPRVGSVTGITSVLRLRRYASGQDERIPDDPRAWARAAADLETLLLTEPELRSYVDVGSLAAARLDVLTRAAETVRIEDLAPDIRRLWERTRDPARLEIVGDGVVSEKISFHLVPTLVESFLITAVVIFVTFFVVFRNPAARLMAMIPSLFAILVMFLLMRVAGIPLNVATILIATTVLGATENDQIHFFFHFQEKRREASTEEALKHAIRVAGSAIFFATLVNAGGFLALALSDLPPMRQFGLLSASAFALSMLADFTALPAALWIVFGERPDPPQA
jgi:predicted RND superfamily exporter protein